MIRTNLTRLFLLLACALAFAGCGPKAPVADSDADVAAITSAGAAWEQAYNDKNADAVAAIYAEDAQLLPQGAPAVKGRAAIREFLGRGHAAGLLPAPVELEFVD